MGMLHYRGGKYVSICVLQCSDVIRGVVSDTMRCDARVITNHVTAVNCARNGMSTVTHSGDNNNATAGVFLQS